MGLLGSGSKGTTNNGKFRAAGIAPGTVDMLAPVNSGDPDMVQQRAGQALKGKMLNVQLRKNKSKGITV